MTIYTKSMEAELASQTPVTFSMAQEFAEKWADRGCSVKSIVSKVKSLGIDYIPKQKAEPKMAKITKAQMVRDIEAKLDCPLDGLQNATVSALENLARAIA